MYSTVIASLLTLAIKWQLTTSAPTVLYQNAGPLYPMNEDYLTDINMADNMFITLDIEITSFPPSGWKYMLFIGDPFARVPDLWLWEQSRGGVAVHFSRDGGGQLTWTLDGSGNTWQVNTKYSLEICYDQTNLVTRTSGGDINGYYVRHTSKKIHDLVPEPLHIGYPSNDPGDADVTITNLVIGRDADCSQPIQPIVPKQGI